MLVLLAIGSRGHANDGLEGFREKTACTKIQAIGDFLNAFLCGRKKHFRAFNFGNFNVGVDTDTGFVFESAGKVVVCIADTICQK